MVKRNFALWKPVSCKGPDGGPVAVGWAITIDKAYDGKLLNRIVEMKIKKPISLDAALKIVVEKKEEAFLAQEYGMKPGQYGWYIYNFVQYISSLGFHIELTCDELIPFGVPEVRV